MFSHDVNDLDVFLTYTSNCVRSSPAVGRLQNNLVQGYIPYAEGSDVQRTTLR